jgi:hypothetical protein
MKRVPAAVQRRELKLIPVDHFEEFRPGRGVAQETVEIAVRSRRKISRSDLDSLNAKPGRGLKRFGQREVHQAVGEESNLHAISLMSCGRYDRPAPTGTAISWRRSRFMPSSYAARALRILSISETSEIGTSHQDS